MPPSLTRRHFIELGSLSALGLILAPLGCSRSPVENAASATGTFPSLFAAPPRQYQPKFRWWWPHGLVDTDEIRREIDIMADSGFGGAEIADVHHSHRGDLSADTHGWGTEPWRKAVAAALDQAAKRGLTIDHTIGPSWPASSCLITPDSEASTKELATGISILDPGQAFSGRLPQPSESERHATPSLQAVQVIRLADGAQPAGKAYLAHAESLIDLLPFVSKEQLQWTPPSKGFWMVIAYWLRGSGQQPEGGPHTEPESFVVDHFSKAGTQAIIDLWQQKVLTPSLRKLIREVGGCLFEDSIEMETKETIWTPLLVEEFEMRRGYSLVPYLPLLVQKKEDHIIEYKDFDSASIRHDWWQTISELFLENHFIALKAWAADLGLGFRGQPYGLRTDAIRAAATLDIAEGESLGFKNLDDYRSLAGGRDMGGNRILSNEAGAYPGSAYSTTWKRILRTLNPQFAAGVNQTVLHGYAYANAPGVQWPGFAAFTPYGGRAGYSEAWGPRQPSWRHINGISGYFARVHFLLQQGQPQVDVAFLRQKGYAGSGFGAPWFSKEGVHSGWTHAFISPATLELPTATVRDGQLAPDGPAFQLLVFEGDAFNKRAETMELPAARSLLRLAQEGLPILVIGDWTRPSTPGKPSTAAEAELASIFAQLLSLDNVANVSTREAIPSGIQKLGIRPRISYPHDSVIVAQRRSGDTRFFYALNLATDTDRNPTVSIDARLCGKRFYALDLWTGAVSRIEPTKSENGRISLPVELLAQSACAFATTNEEWPTGQSSHVALRPAGARSLTSYENAIALSNWKLNLEEWFPGSTSVDTIVRHREVDLSEPTPWTDIPGLEDASGIGTYSAEVELDPAVANNPSVSLYLESAFDTVSITVNGARLPPINPQAVAIPLAGYLKPGPNSIRIETPSTLINRLRISDPKVYSATKPQSYGLTGAVRIVW